MEKEFDLILGTAFWGWKIPEKDIYPLLESALNNGIWRVDAATNYPMNGIPDDFRLGERILREFLVANGISTLRIIQKVGSLSNTRSTEHNLAPSFLLMMAEEYLRLYGPNLACLMVHWDNRNDPAAIQETLQALVWVREQLGIEIGLSGIKHPELYAAEPLFVENPWVIEAKHNVFVSDLDRYAALRKSDTQFLAYGINAGGLKLDQQYLPDSTIFARGGDPDAYAAKLQAIQAALPAINTAQVRPPIRTMNHLGLVHAYNHPALSGVVIGPSTVAQLVETADFARNLGVFDYSDVSKKVNMV